MFTSGGSQQQAAGPIMELWADASWGQAVTRAGMVPGLGGFISSADLVSGNGFWGNDNAPTSGMHNQLGMPCRVYVSAVATAFATQHQIVTFPLPRRYVGGAVQMAPNQGWPLRKWSADAVLFRENPAVAGDIFSCGIVNGGSQFVDDANRLGFFLSSDPAINAGRWTTFWRLTNGGAIVQGNDSNVDPVLTPALIGWEYFEGPSPRLAVRVNGNLVQEWAGLAFMPVIQYVSSSLYQFSIISGSGTAIIGGSSTLIGGHVKVEDQPR